MRVWLSGPPGCSAPWRRRRVVGGVSGLLRALQNMVDSSSHAEIGTVFVAFICVFGMQQGGFVDLTNVLE